MNLHSRCVGLLALIAIMPMGSVRADDSSMPKSVTESQKDMLLNLEKKGAITTAPIGKGTVLNKNDPSKLFLQIDDCGYLAKKAKGWVSDETTCSDGYPDNTNTLKLRYFVGPDANSPAGTAFVQLEASESPSFDKLHGSKVMQVAKDGTFNFLPFKEPFKLQWDDYQWYTHYVRVRSGDTVSNAVKISVPTHIH